MGINPEEQRGYEVPASHSFDVQQVGTRYWKVGGPSIVFPLLVELQAAVEAVRPDAAVEVWDVGTVKASCGWLTLFLRPSGSLSGQR